MLVILLLIPLLFSLSLLVFRKPATVKSISIISSLAELVLTIYLLSQFKIAGGFQFDFNHPWISALGINFHLGIDGIGLLMLLLTNTLMPLIVLAGLKKSPENIHQKYLLLLIAQFALNGVFISLNAFLFYIFWELSLIPVYFIILLWGGEGRQKITLKFFIYTLFGSLLMLIAFIFIYLKTPGTHSTDINAFYHVCLEPGTQKWLFWFLFIGFAIKMPLFPFHTWQPDTYTVAPVQTTMLLAGVMSKMGIFGMLRWLLPVIPWAVYQYRDMVIVFSIIGIIYGGIIALRQKDLKKLAAYSSLAHIGLIGASIFALNIYSLQGAMLQLFAHGINIAGFFFIIDIIEKRTYTRNVNELGGIKNVDKKLAALFMLIMLGNIALPLTNGFIGEFLIFLGIFQYKPLMAVISGLTIIIGAVYMLYVYQKIMLGKTNEITRSFTKIDWKEMLVLTPIVILIIFFGVFPQPLIELVKNSIQGILF